MVSATATKTSRNRSPSREQALYFSWIAAIFVLFGIHFVHLLADFPNHSPWMDYSKYTDEGWYGNAASRLTLTGHWYLAGDFNPAVALPLWPVLLAVVFHFTGVSLAAARLLCLAILGVNLALTYLLLRSTAPRWIALLAVTALSANPFLYAFSRLAILEPLVVCMMLLGWWLALRSRRPNEGPSVLLLAATGAAMFLMVLAKTTGVTLVPSVMFLVAYACGFRFGPTMRGWAASGITSLGLWFAWYLLVMRSRFRVDYQYFFVSNQWPKPSGLGGRLMAFWWALHGTLWISPVLCVITLVLLALVFFAATRAPVTALRRNPLAVASLLAFCGYLFFIGSQNHPQPRYYETMIYPLVFFMVLMLNELIRKDTLRWLRIIGGIAVVAIGAVCVGGVVRIVGYERHPEYSWVKAASELSRYIDEHPAPNKLMLSISGDELQLITHEPAICDDYGTWDLTERIRVYRPSWYAAWNEVDEGTREDIETQYSLHEVASFPAFDDPDRNLLILYRLEPLPAEKQVRDSDDEQAAARN